MQPASGIVRSSKKFLNVFVLLGYAIKQKQNYC